MSKKYDTTPCGSSRVYSSKLLAQLITQICKQHGIKHIVISPGSRNAPLIIGFCNDVDYKVYSIVDERCAGFFGLGIAQQQKMPVALVCTSGSAVANYYPAICEAYYSDVSLVVISADRPQHKIDIGDGQTIRQREIFSNHIVCEVNLRNHPTKATSQIDKALMETVKEKGPVHINVPFEEPLYETTKTVEYTPQSEPYKPNDRDIKPDDKKEFIRKWKSFSKRMILIGQLPPEEIDNSILDEINEDDSTIVLTETTSNTTPTTHKFINGIDKVIYPIENHGNMKKHFQPEILLTVGEMLISKKIKKFLRENPPKYHFHVGEKKAYDTYFCLSHHFRYAPQKLLKIIGEGKTYTSKYTYQKLWLNLKSKVDKRHFDFTKQAPYSDLSVFDYILENLPKNIHLHLGNSSTIRYAQLFAHKIHHPNYCNRGTSGIDGSTSTAIGYATNAQKPCLLITGDLSFFYDSNALWNNYIPRNFKIIVINNSGGGIFRFLTKNPDLKIFNDYLETAHNLNAKPLAELYQMTYHKADDLNTLHRVWQNFITENTSPQILEIHTPRTVNDTVLRDYFFHLGDNTL